MIDGEAVTTVGKFNAPGDTGVLLLVLELAPGEHQWHGVVLLTADDEQRVAGLMSGKHDVLRRGADGGGGVTGWVPSSMN